jgi:hypothetical protein
MVAVLLILPILTEVLFSAAGLFGPFRNNILVALVGAPLLFGGLGLALFNLHQGLLIILVSLLGSRLPLPVVSGLRRKAVIAGGLAALALVLALYLLLTLLMMFGLGRFGVAQYNEAEWNAAARWLLLLPLLVLPCYMMAHDLEAGARDSATVASRSMLAGVASALRWISGLLYIVYVTDAFGLQFLRQLGTGQSNLGELDTFLGILPYLGYFALAPIPVLLILAAVGYVQRALTAGPHSTSGVQS